MTCTNQWLNVSAKHLASLTELNTLVILPILYQPQWFIINQHILHATTKTSLVGIREVIRYTPSSTWKWKKHVIIMWVLDSNIKVYLYLLHNDMSNNKYESGLKTTMTLKWYCSCDTFILVTHQSRDVHLYRVVWLPGRILQMLAELRPQLMFLSSSPWYHQHLMNNTSVQVWYLTIKYFGSIAFKFFSLPKFL